MMNRVTWVWCLVALAGLTGSALADEQSCEKELGTTAAAEMVEKCLAVSPATHPPCNASNPCEMIDAEIARGCTAANNGKELPKTLAFCKDYIDPEGR